MAFKEYLQGSKTQLAWVDETSFGSGGDLSADGEIVGKNARIEPDWNQNWQNILSAGAAERTVQDFELGPLDLPFTLVFTPVTGKFLKYLGYSFTNDGSGPYTHTGSLQDAIQSFKLEWANIKKSGNPVAFELIGCVGKSATISFSKGTGEGGESLITVNMNCHAKGYIKKSTYTDIAATTRPSFKFYHAKVTLNGVETVEVNNGEMTIDQGIDPADSRYCNATQDREVGEFIPKVHRITGRYNINIDDDTEISLWTGAAKINDCKLELIQDSTDNYMEFAFNNLVIPQAIPSINFGEVLAPDIPWRADNFSKIEVVDTLSDY